MRTPANRMLAVVVVVIALIAIVAAALSAGRSTKQWPADSPQGVVQRYLAAAFERDSDRAVDFLDPSGDCDVSDLDRAYAPAEARVDLVESSVSGNTARVEVRVEYSNDDPFGNGYSEEHILRLVRVSGEWRLTGVPWPLWDCGTMVK